MSFRHQSTEMYFELHFHENRIGVKKSHCVELLDGRVPVLRSTIELISGVESTPDLLQEIQQQNEGRISRSTS